MSIPVFVCVRSTPSALLTEGQCMPMGELGDEPIGFLRGFETGELSLDDSEMLRRELEPLGLELRYLARGVKAAHGCRGALLAYAVSVGTWEEALALPGFSPLGHWTGATYLPPKSLPLVMNVTEDTFEGVEIKRVPVSEGYDEFEPPPYDQDGCFCLSMIPQGRLGCIYFFREDPLYFYVEAFSADRDEASRRDRVCRFMATQRI